MASHDRDPPDDGADTPRPAFDVVARGYDPDQVDGYVRALWRYSSDLTARVAAAEAALRHERDRRAADTAAQVGDRIGRMLAISQQMADEIVAGARLVAEQTLYEVVSDAGAHHPITQEAREQAGKLLADAVAEARRLARERHEDIEAEIARSAASLDALRRQQGELLGAMLRLRGLVASDDMERAVGDLARAGAEHPPGDHEHPDDERPPTPTQRAAPGDTADSAPAGAAGTTDAGTAEASAGQRHPAPPDSGPAAAGPRSAADRRGPDRPAPGMANGRQPSGHAAGRRQTGTGPTVADVLDGELYPTDSTPLSPPTGPLRRGADQEIVDAEIVDR